MTPNRRTFKELTVFGVALVAAGSVLTYHLVNPNKVKADGNRVFELRIYHVVPGRVSALESRFRDTTAKLLAKHDLKVLGYWVPDDAPASDNTFVFLLAHSSREEAKKNWDAMRADPSFQEMVKAEQSDKLVERVDVTYMHPTDFSQMR